MDGVLWSFKFVFNLSVAIAGSQHIASFLTSNFASLDLDLDLDLDLAVASKCAIVQAPPIATSGGRAEFLRREV
ncbi:hypothetical protein, partial [Pseudomonas carassii]